MSVNPTPMKEGSVIAITVLFMSFLLIGIVGAAYLLSSHLRITSLSSDFLQASYNAESGLEVALYEIKHRREGYENETTLTWDTKSLSSSSIDYRMKANEKVVLPLLGGTKKLALYYEDAASGDIRQIKDMTSLVPQLTVYSTKTESGPCLDVNLVGKHTTSGDFESIGTQIPCTQKNAAPTAITSLSDKTPRTGSMVAGQDYTFTQFLATHEDVLLLIGDISKNQAVEVELSLLGASDSPESSPRTVASPSLKIEALGTFNATTITKGIELPQDSLPNILSRVIVY